MKRYLYSLSVMLFLLATSNNAFAQGNDATVTASATTIASISLEQSAGPNFGNVEADLSPTPTLDASDVNNSSNVSSGASLGYAYYSGEASATVSISWNPGTVTLTGLTHTAETMDFTPSIYAESGNTYSGGSGGGTEVANSGGTASFSTGGDLTIWIGGTLGNPSTTLSSQTFEGNLTISVDYTL